MNFKTYLADAIRYWETRRVVYNVVLAVLAMICWGPDIIPGGPREWLGGGAVLFALAVIANVLYCVAYPVDLVVQATPFKSILAAARPLLFFGGLALASSLALWVMLRTGMA